MVVLPFWNMWCPFFNIDLGGSIIYIIFDRLHTGRICNLRTRHRSWPLWCDVRNMSETDCFWSRSVFVIVILLSHVYGYNYTYLLHRSTLFVFVWRLSLKNWSTEVQSIKRIQVSSWLTQADKKRLGFLSLKSIHYVICCFHQSKNLPATRDWQYLFSFQTFDSLPRRLLVSWRSMQVSCYSFWDIFFPSQLKFLHIFSN